MVTATLVIQTPKKDVEILFTKKILIIRRYGKLKKFTVAGQFVFFFLVYSLCVCVGGLRLLLVRKGG
jgi:hypothetical protein